MRKEKICLLFTFCALCGKKLSLPSEAKGRLEKMMGTASDNVMSMCASVLNISSNSFVAKGLKFGMKTHFIHAMKFTNQIFEYLSRSWVFKCKEL